jgi:hypothetical protein
MCSDLDLIFVGISKMIDIRSIDPRAASGPGNLRRVEVRLVSMFNTLSIDSYTEG